MTTAEILEEAAGKSLRRCAWCGEDMEWDGLTFGSRTSHGICADCAAAVFGVALEGQDEKGGS